MARWMSYIVACLLLAGTIGGCSSGSPQEEVCRWDSLALVQERKQKDAWLRYAPQSPLPDSLRQQFAGLPYYPPNRTFVFVARLERFSPPDTVVLQATYANDLRRMIRFGRLHFSYDGRPLALTVYQEIGAERAGETTVLFLPFRDATNGTETYEGGRYLNVPFQPGQQWYCLDFNRAYNPYCAYNAAYSCPLVPEENVLNVSIRAGEKKWQSNAP